MSPRFALVSFAAISLSFLPSAPAADAPATDHWIVRLEDYGPTKTPADVSRAWAAARDALKGRAGIVIVPSDAWAALKPDSLQSLIRTPEPPAQTKQWKIGPGTTVLTADRERTLLEVPPLSGLKIERDFRLNDGDSAPHWGTHPMLQLDSRIVKGTISYLDWLQAPTAKGADARFYVPTVRGLSPGQFINVHGNSGYGGGVIRACIKSLGWDAEKQLHYFVADTDMDHRAGAIAQNKSNSGIIHMTQTSNADNQTYDVKVIRNQYAHGDTYVYYCDFNYMTNVHSAAGDENGNCYAAFIRSKDSNFRGAVESVDGQSARLTFSNSAANVETLGNSRPLINLNPEKHIFAGKVMIVPGSSEFDTPDAPKSVLNGTDYSGGLVKNEITGTKERKFGGLIRGERDCPWDAGVVGRYFAVNEASEKTPKGVLRWYLITKFHANADGTKDIEIQRFWWGAKDAGAPTLYRPENYSWDGHAHPLTYIIAPGAYVNDVSHAILGGDRGGQRTLGMSPHSTQGTQFDFAKGDKIEQAIGPDPFKPQAMRVWMWEDVPGQFPAAVFDVANQGATSRYSVISARGGPANLDDLAARHEPKPAWDNIIVQDSAATVGFNLKADFANAAILFHQPNREQPIKWHYGHVKTDEPDSGKSGITKAIATPSAEVKVASLTVSRATGEFQFTGGGLQSGGPVSGVAGISGDAKPARNFRGKNVTVAPGQTTVRVKFTHPEVDADYAVLIEQSWLTNRAVSEKTAEGFSVTFSAASPASATLDWMLVR